LDNPEKLAT